MDYFIQRLTIKSESPFNPGNVIPGIYCFQLILVRNPDHNHNIGSG